MIWGVRLEPGKIHCEHVSQDVHITMAAMESWDAGDTDRSKSLVFLQVQQSEYLLCTLTGVLLQQHLDMRLTQGEKLTFSVRGKNSVYLTGYSEGTSGVQAPAGTRTREVQDDWEERWTPKEMNSNDQGVSDRGWEAEDEDFSGRPANCTLSKTNPSNAPVLANIKRETDDDGRLVGAGRNGDAEMTSDQEKQDDESLDEDDAGESVSSREMSQEKSTDMRTPPFPTGDCMPSVMSSGIRLHPPVCITSSLDARLPGGLVPLAYPSPPRQLLPPMSKISQEVSMNYQTTMLNKLKLLHQRLNPSNNHSFLLPPYPGLPSSGLPDRPPSTEAVTNRKPREKPPPAASEENPPVESETYKCPMCQRVFMHKGHFKRHMENSHGGKYQQQAPPTEEYHCHYCDKVFVSKHRLRTHEHGHEGIRPYKCQICGKGFTQSGTCRRHERIHVGFKPFKCRFCNRTFLQTKDLKKHEVLHLRELMSKETVSCM